MTGGSGRSSTKAVPAKADVAKQEAFIEEYLTLIAETATDEPILFIDGAMRVMELLTDLRKNIVIAIDYIFIKSSKFSLMVKSTNKIGVV